MSCSDKKNIALVVLMGLPASGKSTLSDEITNVFNEEKGTLVVKMVYDSFVPIEKQMQFVSESSGNAAKILRKNFVNCVQFLINKFSGQDESLESLEAKLSSEADFMVPRKLFIEQVDNLRSSTEGQNKVLMIVDDNNYYHSMRNEFYQVAKHAEIGFCVLYCKSTIKSCRNRNSTRPSYVQVPDKVIVEMSTKLEEPNPLENVCDLYCFQIPELNSPTLPKPSLNSNSGRYQGIMPLLLSILENALKTPLSLEPVVDRSEEISKERKICSQNAVHQADLILRKWMHTEITLSSFSTKNHKDLKSLSSELNRKKCIVIEGLKSGELKLFAEVHQDIEFRKEIISLAQNVKI